MHKVQGINIKDVRQNLILSIQIRIIMKNGLREYQLAQIHAIIVSKKLLKLQIIHKQKDKMFAVPNVIKLWIKCFN